MPRPAPAPAGARERPGEVFTRPWVVRMILDLVGYTADRDLAGLVIVEPACGAGAFLGEIVARLSASCRTHGRPLSDAATAVRAFDLSAENLARSTRLVRTVLASHGRPDTAIEDAARSWLTHADYLLLPDPPQADVVVGNPPYIRLEETPAERMRAYRAACPTMTGRADVYIGFYERGLRSLRPGGKLGVVCADRWMRNQYGRALRALVTAGYAVDVILGMHDVDAFDDQVAAYPAITVLRNGTQRHAVAATATRAFGAPQAAQLTTWLRAPTTTRLDSPAYHAAVLPGWFRDDQPWPSASPARLAVLEQLAARFGPLESDRTGTRVGIGVATGADRIFLAGPATTPDIENDRLLPLATVADTTGGAFAWTGTRLVNPWATAGGLVDLAAFPRLAGYVDHHRAALIRRYLATRHPHRWYATIDRVNHHLTARPKLLLPDLKSTIHPVLEGGGHYPHHNLYYIVSDTWDLNVLGGLLLSAVAEAFVAAYAVRMRGGTLRFQAQYLRRIRVPDPAAITPADRAALAAAFDRRDTTAATEAALRVYGLTELPG